MAKTGNHSDIAENGAPSANAADSALVQIIFAAASTLLSPPECALPGSKSYGVNVVYNQKKMSTRKYLCFH